MSKLHVTQHSGTGLGCVGHNDRKRLLEAKAKGKEIEDTHIDLERSKNNVYIAYNVQTGQFDVGNNLEKSLKDYEKEYYQEMFSEALEQANEKHIKSRHYNRCKTIEQICADKLPNGRPNRTAPEEMILQIGDRNNHVSDEVFTECVTEYLSKINEWSKAHGNPMQILDISIHVDEATPHAHVRRVWQYTDEDGLTRIGQAKALEQARVALPDPNKKEFRKNNRKMTFDKSAREYWQRICKSHGIDIETEVKEPGRKHIQNKEQYVAFKLDQQENLLAQENELIGKSIEQLNENANLGVFEGLERGLELPEGSITETIQKSLTKTATVKNVLPSGTTFQDYFVEELAREVNNLIKPDKEKSRDREFDDEIYANR